MGRTTVIRNDVAARPVKEVERIWMTRKEAARYLGVSETWVKRLNLSAKLRFSKVEGTAFILKSDIDKLIRDNYVFGRGL